VTAAAARGLPEITMSNTPNPVSDTLPSASDASPGGAIGATNGQPLPAKGQPPGLFLLFIVEMWERFSYYGMRALLVLYLVTSTAGMEGREPGFNPGRGWAEGDAYRLYGWYTGLAYLLPVVGGLLADKFLGTHRSMLLGGSVIALGHVVLAISGLGALEHSALGMSTFIGGLALIIIGTGYFKPCVSVMVGQLYPEGDPRRDGGFTIFYMGINLGAFICTFVCGTLGEKVGWHWGFGAAAVGMLAGMAVYLVGRPKFLKGIGEPPANAPNILPALLVASLVLSAGVAWLFHVGFFGRLGGWVSGVLANQTAQVAVPLGVTALVVGVVGWFVAIQKPGDKGPVACIFIFMLFNAFFWLAFEQAGSTLNVFAFERTNRVIFGWDMPASWFQSVNPFVIITMAPAFAFLWSALGRRNLNPSQPVKIGLGLLLLGGGYVFMVIGAKLSESGEAGEIVRVSMFWLFATYTLHTLGELCLSPTGLSFVTKAAPVRFVSLLMGVWFISSFIANLGGGYIASYVEQIEQGKLFPPILGGRADFFLVFVISSCGAGLLILLLTPLLKRMLHGRG